MPISSQLQFFKTALNFPFRSRLTTVEMNLHGRGLRLAFKGRSSQFSEMKEFLVIPKQYHRLLVARAAVLWPEYRALQNGIIVKNPGGEEVHILCDSQRIELIMNFAQRACVEALPHIRRVGDCV